MQQVMVLSLHVLWPRRGQVKLGQQQQQQQLLLVGWVWLLQERVWLRQQQVVLLWQMWLHWPQLL
jgi:hypothetical protein